MVVKKGAENKKHCGLCGDRGHHQYLCQRIKSDYGKYPLPNKDNDVRTKLGNNLIAMISVPTSPLFTKVKNDIRQVKKELPSKITGLVIHRRLTDNPLLIIQKPSDICVECTVIRDKYRKDEKGLYEVGVIVRHIFKNPSNLIVNLLS